jgi:hypothetical protein
MNPATKPSARDYHAMVYDSANNKVVLFGGYYGSYYDDTWVYDVAADTWIQMNPATKPSERSGPAMVYDSANNKIVLFGGYDGSNYDDTWVYEYPISLENTGHYNWRVPNVYTANALIKVTVTDIWGNTVSDTSDTSFTINPLPLISSQAKATIEITSPNGGEDWIEGACYPITWNAKGDLRSNPVSIYYSIDNGNSWIVDSWTQMNPAAKPSARDKHTMAYDSTNNKVVLFGGQDAGGNDDETWVYDVATDTWTQKNQATKPSARVHHAMAYDSANNKVVLFGGQGVGGDETWVYDVAANTWTQMNPPTKPSARSKHVMAYDSANNRVVLFGGYAGGNKDETWVYDTAADNWTQMNPLTKPSGRVYHQMAYDSENKKIVLFGGMYSSIYDNETWIYDLALDTWTQMNPAVKPLGREGHTMTYDSANNKIVLFGGYNGSAASLNDIWIYEVATNIWTQMNPTLKPSARYSSAMAYDSASNKIVLFGGADGSLDDETWVYETTISLENTGHYNWTVPNVNTANALIKVTVTDIYGNTVSDTSDASFAIDPPPPINGLITSPNAGTIWGQGENSIVWNIESSMDSIALDYTLDGQNWTDIKTNLPNTNSYTWDIPEGINSKNAQIRLGVPGDYHNMPTILSSIFTIDTESPIITHEPISNGTMNKALGFEASVTDNFGVSSVTLYHNDGSGFVPISMNEENGLYRASIIPTTEGTIEYYITVSDGANYASTDVYHVDIHSLDDQNPEETGSGDKNSVNLFLGLIVLCGLIYSIGIGLVVKTYFKKRKTK